MTKRMTQYACAVLLLAASWRAGAADTPSPLPAMAPLPTLVPEIVIKVADPAGFDAPVAKEQLGRQRGGADTVSNTMRLDGAVTGNAAVNVLSGANAIGSGSFSNASGLPTAIQNSGANVLIQNATIINIEMR